MNDQFLQGVLFDWNRIDNDSYLKRIKAFKGIEKLVFNKPITFFVGENGSGKSTLLEALAVAHGFNPEGGTTMSLFVTAVLEYTESLVAPIVIHFLWNGVGAIILGGVSLAEDYPHLFNMVISGNSILSGGSCKIEGSIVVLFMNLILMFGFVMAKKKRDKNL